MHRNPRCKTKRKQILLSHWLRPQSVFQQSPARAAAAVDDNRRAPLNTNKLARAHPGVTTTPPYCNFTPTTCYCCHAHVRNKIEARLMLLLTPHTPQQQQQQQQQQQHRRQLFTVTSLLCTRARSPACFRRHALMISLHLPTTITLLCCRAHANNRRRRRLCRRVPLVSCSSSSSSSSRGSGARRRFFFDERSRLLLHLTFTCEHLATAK